MLDLVTVISQFETTLLHQFPPTNGWADGNALLELEEYLKYKSIIEKVSNRGTKNTTRRRRLTFYFDLERCCDRRSYCQTYTRNMKTWRTNIALICIKIMQEFP
jgi:hypothetical protein